MYCMVSSLLVTALTYHNRDMSGREEDRRTLNEGQIECTGTGAGMITKKEIKNESE